MKNKEFINWLKRLLTYVKTSEHFPTTNNSNGTVLHTIKKKLGEVSEYECCSNCDEGGNCRC